MLGELDKMVNFFHLNPFLSIRIPMLSFNWSEYFDKRLFINKQLFLEVVKR